MAKTLSVNAMDAVQAGMADTTAAECAGMVGAGGRVTRIHFKCRGSCGGPCGHRVIALLKWLDLETFQGMCNPCAAAARRAKPARGSVPAQAGPAVPAKAERVRRTKKTVPAPC
jgi:hypothetical protein